MARPILYLFLFGLIALSEQCDDFPTIVKKSGRKAEEYEVTTEDGYILKLYRIPPSKKCCGKEKKIPLLFVHAFTQSAASFLDADLGYYPSDDCYDTWFANHRGTYESRRHVKLNADCDEAYWDFSYHELGVYDLPAIIDKVLKVTCAPKLNYLGYSQGGGGIIILCSEKKNYCQKINLNIALAPCTRHLNTPSSIQFRKATIDANKYSCKLKQNGVVQITSETFPGTLASLCKALTKAGVECCWSKDLLDNPHPGSISDETMKKIAGHFPVGTSIKTFAHHGQSMTDKEFRKFDYGPDKNKEVYGCCEAPVYNFDALKAKTVYIYGKNDGIVDKADHEWACKKIPNLLETFVMKDCKCNHLDLVYASDINVTLYPTIKKYLDKYDGSC